MDNEYYVHKTPRAKIKYFEDGVEKSRIEPIVIKSDTLLIIYKTMNQYDEPPEIIGMNSPNFISVKWLDMEKVELID